MKIGSLITPRVIVDGMNFLDLPPDANILGAGRAGMDNAPVVWIEIIERPDNITMPRIIWFGSGVKPLGGRFVGMISPIGGEPVQFVFEFMEG